MANLNALIAQGYQFQQPPDPFVQYGRMQQLEQGQQANQLNRMKMQEAERANVQANMLNQAYASSVDPLTGEIDYAKVRRAAAAGGAGSQIPAIEESRLKQETARLTQQKTAGEVAAQPVKLSADKAKLLDDKLKLSRQFLDTLDPADPNAPARYLAWHEANHADPDIGPALTARGVTAAQARAQIDAAIARGPQAFAQMLNQSKLGTEKFMEMNKPTTQVIDQSGQRQVIQIPGLGGTPTTVGTYADVPLPAAVAEQRARVARAGAPTVNVSNVQERAEAADYGKLLVKDYDAVKASSDLARKSLPALESNLAILNNGFSTGFGTETVAAGAKVLGALGVKDAEKFATNAQVFLANANNAVLQKQLEQKGVQTAADADRITSTGAQFGNTKDANEFIIKVAMEQLKRDIEQRDFYAAWRDKNQTFNGAENAWSTGPGNKSLFDRPALKRYAAAPPPSGANLIPGSTPAAGGGATVTLPDGRVKTFPNAAAANQFKKAAGL